MADIIFESFAHEQVKHINITVINLIAHHVQINKLINLLTHFQNWIYFITPIRSATKYLIRLRSQRISEYQFVNRLSLVLGDIPIVENFMGYDEDVSKVIASAEDTLRHEYDVLGSGKTVLDPIEWHKDIKSGHVWEKGMFYKRYDLVSSHNKSDVKVPWEISRCHHLLWLGQAFLVTKDEKYAKRVVDDLTNWIEENPFLCSINWTCSMDVSIRAVNIMHSLNMIRSYSSIHTSFIEKCKESLFQHGWYVYNNLEKWHPYSANHYLTNLVGLIHLGQLFRESKDGYQWYNYAIGEYYYEARLQILGSGAHFERTTSYHRLVTELFSYTAVVLERVGEVIPIDVRMRIKSLYEYIDAYTKPNGLSPLIGDNDDGRFLPFVKRDFRNHSYLLSIADSLYPTEYGRVIQSKSNVLDSLMLGLRQVSRAIQEAETPKIQVSKYLDLGMVIIKNQSDYMLLTNSSLSGYPDIGKKVHPTHTHDDGMSFELMVDGEDVFVDTGAYVYTASPRMRSMFRSSYQHNTLVLDEIGQTKTVEGNVFNVTGFKEVEPMVVVEGGNFVAVTGRRLMSDKNKRLVMHTRKVYMSDEKYIYINDTVEGIENNSVESVLVLAPGIQPVVNGTTIELYKKDQFLLFLKAESSETISFRVSDAEYSPSYGVKIQTKKVICEAIKMKESTLNIQYHIEYRCKKYD